YISASLPQPRSPLTPRSATRVFLSLCPRLHRSAGRRGCQPRRAAAPHRGPLPGAGRAADGNVGRARCQRLGAIRRPTGGRPVARQAPTRDIVISPKLDRCFRSSLDALQTIEELKRRHVSLWLLDPGGDVSGNGISEMMLTVLSAVAQFERVRIG